MISLESIKFPSTIRYIGENAFDHSSPVHNHSDLREVVFNDGLLRIGEGAFNECRSLLSIIYIALFREISWREVFLSLYKVEKGGF